VSGPGHSSAVIHEGRIDRLDVVGLANADTGTPLTPDSIFYVGSVAKQFVAACAAILMADGVLDADAPVTAHVEDLPSWAHAVRIRHLVHHTSGIPDPNLSTHDGMPVGGVRAWDSDRMLGEIRAVETLASAPGTRYAYSNRGYNLLSQVIASAAGQRLSTCARERLLTPLGMRDTFFRDAPTPLPPSAARGHFEAVDGRTYVEPALFHAVGSGGLWTTIRDLARWDAAFYDETTIAPRLTARGSLDDGTPIHYAWGLSVRIHRGQPIHSHGGSFPGWSSKMVRFPLQRTTVVVLANHERLDVSAMSLTLAEDILGGALDPAAAHADDTFDGTR